MPRVPDDLKRATDKVCYQPCLFLLVMICDVVETFRMDGMLYIMLVLEVFLKCWSG